MTAPPPQPKGRCLKTSYARNLVCQKPRMLRMLENYFATDSWAGPARAGKMPLGQSKNLARTLAQADDVFPHHPGFRQRPFLKPRYVTSGIIFRISHQKRLFKKTRNVRTIKMAVVSR